MWLIKGVMNVITYILNNKKLYTLFDESSTLKDICKCFDYALEKMVPKCIIKLRMAALFAKIFSDSLTENFTIHWFTYLFSDMFSKEICLQIMEMFLLGGWCQIFKIGLAIMMINEGK